jgi:hypothetical protein
LSIRLSNKIISNSSSDNNFVSSGDNFAFFLS